MTPRGTAPCSPPGGGRAALPLLVRWLGRVAYVEALALQQELVEARRIEKTPDTLLLLEHDPVITIGRAGDRDHVLWSDERLAAQGVEVHETGRGGDVTYHGPGQLVGYPVLALRGERRDAHRYLRDIEEVLIRTAADYDVAAQRSAGLTGVWTGGRKLAAIGVRIGSGWITSHGFAVNVGRDLSGFGAIVPCGIYDRGVTSLGLELDREPPLEEVAARAAVHLAAAMALEAVLPQRVEERLALPGARTLSLKGDFHGAGIR